jgi:hypothetical protein
LSTLGQKVNALISGLSDPRVRIDVAQTINFLFGVYCQGKVKEDEVRGDLYEICHTVVRESNPLIAEDEVRVRAEALTDDFLRTFKVQSLNRRLTNRIIEILKTF